MGNSTEKREQRILEGEALNMRKQALTQHVLRHWIEVGNYWVNKKHQYSTMPNEELKSKVHEISDIRSPPKVSKTVGQEQLTEDSKNLTPDDKYDYSFSKKRGHIQVAPRQI